MQITFTEALSLLTALGAILVAWSTRRKNNADSADLEDQITERVLLRANGEMTRMQREIDDLRAQLDRYQVWNTMLCQQVVGLGRQPVAMPEARKK